MAAHNDVGRIGEDVALRFLVKRGMKEVGRNFRNYLGEIDLIVRDGKELVFVEVKTISRENLRTRERMRAFSPADNLHPHKMRKFRRIVELYLAKKRVSSETLWRLDAVFVLLDLKNKEAKIEHLKDI